MSSKSDIQNGGSYCITLTWQDGSTTSNFLGTLVQSIGGYYVWLEEGIRSFVSTAAVFNTGNELISQYYKGNKKYINLLFYSRVGHPAAYLKDSGMPR